MALSFLTVLPVGPCDADGRDLAAATPHFPLAGYVVGLVVGGVLWLPVPVPPGVRAALAVLAWLVVTGMLHLDGLLDSADGLLAAVPPQRRLEILRDVRIGAFGFGAATATLLVLWSALAAGVAWWVPVVAAVVARFVITGPLHAFPPARPGGMGAAARGGRWWLGALYVVPVLLLPGALVAGAAALAVVWAGAWWAARRLGGGLTGDVVGALALVAEVVVVLSYVTG